MWWFAHERLKWEDYEFEVAMDLYNDTLSNKKALFLFPIFSYPSKFQFSITSYYTLLAII